MLSSRKRHRAARVSPAVWMRRFARQTLEAVPPAWRLAGRVWSWVWPPLVGVLIGSGIAVTGAVIAFLLFLEYGL